MESLFRRLGYIPISFINDGRYSSVYKVHCLEDEKAYAIKVISSYSMDSEEDINLNTEIRALSIASHRNIVGLKEAFQCNQNILLVLEYSPYNLTNVLRVKKPESIIKGMMLMLLQGISHLHGLGIVHRDVKPSNILINSKGVLQICDLGLCKFWNSNGSGQECELWSSQAGTSYYRAPELLLGADRYDDKVDIWAIGCVMAELINGRVLFDTSNELEHIGLIVDLIGTPDAETWEYLTGAPIDSQVTLRNKAAPDLRTIFPNWSNDEIDLFSKLIVFDPRKRLSAREAIAHSWFFSEPVPCVCPFSGRSFDLLSCTAI